MNGGRAAALGALIAVGYMAVRSEIYRRVPVTDAAALAPEELDRLTDERLFLATGAHWRDGAVEAAPVMDSNQARAAFAEARAIRESLTHPFSWDLWFRRDLVMGLPRLAGFALCLLVMGMNGGWRRWGWHRGAPAPPGLLLTVLFSGYLAQFLGRAKVAAFTPGQVALGWLATVPVALFEEAAFRGLVFLGLRGLWGARKAALASSLMFMAWHYQAQSVAEWPTIFLYGLAACGALQAGAGLPVLALTHEVVDSVWYSIGSGGGPLAHPALALGGFLLMAAAAAWGWRLLGRAGGEET